MAILSAPLDYTDKDFDSLKDRIFNLISSVFPTWSETDVADFGNSILESDAFIGDVLCYYLDNQANESRWSKAQLRRNMIAMAKLIDFTPSGATASQVDVTISLIGGALANDVLIPVDTVVRTTKVGEIVRFRLLADVTIPAGGTTALDVSAENSDPESDTFSSTGLPNQEIAIPGIPFLDESETVSAGNGVYTRVDNFLDSTASDRHYTVTIDQDDQAIIRFGNGINGAIPSGTIVADYRTGGGSAGIVEAGTVTVIEGFFTDVLGNPVSLSVTNPEDSSSAVNRQSTEQIRERAPLSIRSVNRTVSRDDFENHALQVAGVGRALMLTGDQDIAIAENSGVLFIVPEQGGVPTQSLKDAVEYQVTVEKPHTLTFQLLVLNPLYLTVNVRVIVHFDQGQTPATVKARILANLQSYFAPLNEDGSTNARIDFGYYFTETTGDQEGKLPWSKIFTEIEETSGVNKIDDANDRLLLNGEDDDVALLLREFPTLGTLTVINAATGTEV